MPKVIKLHIVNVENIARGRKRPHHEKINYRSAGAYLNLLRVSNNIQSGEFTLKSYKNSGLDITDTMEYSHLRSEMWINFDKKHNRRKIHLDSTGSGEIGLPKDHALWEWDREGFEHFFAVEHFGGIAKPPHKYDIREHPQLQEHIRESRNSHQRNFTHRCHTLEDAEQLCMSIMLMIGEEKPPPNFYTGA